MFAVLTHGLPSRGSLSKRVRLQKRACVPTPSQTEAPAPPNTPAPTATPEPEPAPTTTEPAPPAPTVQTLPRDLPWKNAEFATPAKLWVQPEVKDDWGLQVLQRSLVGLAARHTMEDASVPMLWIKTNGDPDNLLRGRFVSRTGVPTEDIDGDVWAAVKKYAELGVVKGFVVYKYDDSKTGEGDFSANIATSMSAHLGAVVVGEGMIDAAKDAGLEQLADARGMTYDDLVATGFKFNPDLAAILRTDMHAAREMVIATGAMVAVDAANGGYFKALDGISVGGTTIGYGLHEHDMVMTGSERGGKGLVASDWTTNWPVLASGPLPELGQFRTNHTKMVDDGESHYVAFVLTDGDNLSWTIGDGATSPTWYSSKHRGKIPFTWGLPVSSMYQTVPDSLDWYLETASPNDGFINFCDSYAFLEVIHEKVGSDAVTAFIKRRQPWAHRVGLDLAMVFTDVWDSPAAQGAYDDIARAAPDLDTLFVLQYGPYAAGQGKVMYGSRGDGQRRLPVVSAKIALWNAGPTDFLGGPEFVAGKLDEWARDKSPGKPLADRVAWVPIHAWSSWEAPEDAQDIARNGKLGGYQAGLYTSRLLKEGQKLVTLWDIQDMFNAAA